MPQAEGTSATPPATVTITVEQFEKMKTAVEAAGAIASVKDGMKGIEAYALQRAAESEARLKRIESEVMQRGLQIARVERNLVELFKKQGVPYSEK